MGLALIHAEGFCGDDGKPSPLHMGRELGAAPDVWQRNPDVMAIRVRGICVPGEGDGGQLLPCRGFLADRGDDRVDTAVLQPPRDEGEHERGVGIWTLARRAAAKSPAASRSGVSRNETRSPGAMHFDR